MVIDEQDLNVRLGRLIVNYVYDGLSMDYMLHHKCDFNIHKYKVVYKRNVLSINTRITKI